MMARTDRLLAITAAALLALLGLRVLLSADGPAGTWSPPTLPAGDVVTVEFVGAGTRARLERGVNGWTVQPEGWPARTNRVTELLAAWEALPPARLAPHPDDARAEVELQLRTAAGDTVLVDLLPGGMQSLGKEPGAEPWYALDLAGAPLLSADPRRWREARPWPVEPLALEAFGFQTDAGDFEFVRDEGGRWSVAGSGDSVAVSVSERIEGLAAMVTRLETRQAS